MDRLEFRVPEHTDAGALTGSPAASVSIFSRFAAMRRGRGAGRGRTSHRHSVAGADGRRTPRADANASPRGRRAVISCQGVIHACGQSVVRRVQGVCRAASFPPVHHPALRACGSPRLSIRSRLEGSRPHAQNDSRSQDHPRALPSPTRAPTRNPSASTGPALSGSSAAPLRPVRRPATAPASAAASRRRTASPAAAPTSAGATTRGRASAAERSGSGHSLRRPPRRRGLRAHNHEDVPPDISSWRSPIFMTCPEGHSCPRQRRPRRCQLRVAQPCPQALRLHQQLARRRPRRQRSHPGQVQRVRQVPRGRRLRPRRGQRPPRSLGHPDTDLRAPASAPNS